MEKVPITREGQESLRQELERLLKEERPANIQAIEAARSHGDLSENAEYHAAKERQAFLEGASASCRSSWDSVKWSRSMPAVTIEPFSGLGFSWKISTPAKRNHARRTVRVRPGTRPHFHLGPAWSSSPRQGGWRGDTRSHPPRRPGDGNHRDRVSRGGCLELKLQVVLGSGVFFLQPEAQQTRGFRLGREE